MDENAKTHPMLRPYKTFSEKVNTFQEQKHHNYLLIATCSISYICTVQFMYFFINFCGPGQGDLPLAYQGVHQGHAGLGVDPGEGQGWRGRGVEAHHLHPQDLPDGSGKQGQMPLWKFQTISVGFESSTAAGPMFLCGLSPQATYDPSHGYSPQPVDITAMALSRELQVRDTP